MTSVFAINEVCKTPDESIRVTFDFTNQLDSGDSISGNGTPSLVTPTSGLTVAHTATSSPLSTARISSGTAGVDYTVKCQVATTEGDTLEIYGTIKVRNTAS